MSRVVIILSREGTIFWARDAHDPRRFAPGHDYLFALGLFLAQHIAPHLHDFDERALATLYWDQPDLPDFCRTETVWSQDQETQDYLRALREKAT